MQQHEALKGVGAVGFTVDHIQDFVLNGLRLAVAGGPVVARACASSGDIEVFRVVDAAVSARTYSLYDPGLKVEQDCAGDVASVIRLVEEDVFAVTAFGCEGFELACRRDAMFTAELLPEFRAD